MMRLRRCFLGCWLPTVVSGARRGIVLRGLTGSGSIRRQFGGCGNGVPNCIPVVKGWNYTVRLYRPRVEITSGKWQFPEAKPVG